MSPDTLHASDERTAHALRTAIDPVVPPMSLDPSDLLRAGQRYRRRRTALISTVGALAIGAVVVGGIELAGTNRADTAPADPVQTPHSIGTEQVAEPAPGVLAANRPEARTLDDGREVLDTGMTASWWFDSGGMSPTENLALVVYRADADAWNAAHPDAAAPRPDHVASLGFTRGGELSTFEVDPWTWNSTSNAADFGPGGTASALSSTLALTDGTRVYSGSVPGFLPDPRVILYSPRGFLLADGSLTHSIEMPTFAAPTDDHALLYLARVFADQDVLGDAEGAPGAMVVLYVGADGTVIPGLGCQGLTVESCATSVGSDLLVAAGINPPEQSSTTAEPEWVSQYPAAPVTTELAPGITAAAQPSLRVLDDGRYLADTGLPSDGYHPDRTFGIVAADPDWANYYRDSSEAAWTGDTAVDLVIDPSDVPRSSALPLAWDTADETADWYLLRSVRATHVMQLNGNDPEGTQVALVGIAPSGMDNQSLEVCFGRAADFDGGRPTCLQDVPLFRAPTADGRQMFLVRFDASLGYGASELLYGLVFTDSTGVTIPWAGCQATSVDPDNTAIPQVSEWCTH